MHTDQIYIARDGKSGMHVLVRILAVDDIGKDYLPIDPDDFNKLMMARDVKSLVLAARDLGPMYISADILSRRTFIPSHLQQHIGHGVNLAPSDIESLLSECYFDPYAIPDEIAGMGYRAIGRTGKKATRREASTIWPTRRTAGVRSSRIQSPFSIWRRKPSSKGSSAMISTSPTCHSSIASRIRHAIGTPANSNSRSMAN